MNAEMLNRCGNHSRHSRTVKWTTADKGPKKAKINQSNKAARRKEEEVMCESQEIKEEWKRKTRKTYFSHQKKANLKGARASTTSKPNQQPTINHETATMLWMKLNMKVGKL